MTGDRGAVADLAAVSDDVVHLARSSFAEARDKLSWEAFAQLLDKTNLEHDEPGDRASGHRVRAVDGTVLQLPRSKEILETFPIRHVRGGDPHYPQALVVSAVNVFTAQPTHLMVGGKFESEQRCLIQLFDQFSEGDIAILDRGYHGRPVWPAIASGIRFLYERRKEARRVSLRAIVWALETGFDILLENGSKKEIGNRCAAVALFGHSKQPGRSYERFSRQLENKWIREKRKGDKRRSKSANRTALAAPRVKSLSRLHGRRQN